MRDQFRDAVFEDFRELTDGFPSVSPWWRVRKHTLDKMTNKMRFLIGLDNMVQDSLFYDH